MKIFTSSSKNILHFFMTF